MTTDNLTTTVIIHSFSSIFINFHSFSHVVTAYFSLILHVLSTLIFHQFSLIFTHFHSFFVVCCRLSCRRPFLKNFTCPWTPIRTLSSIFTHFHSFPQFHTCFSSFFINFHSFHVVCCQLSRCRPFLKNFTCPWTPPRTFIPEHTNNRKFSINNISLRLKLHLSSSFMRADSRRSLRKAQCVCVFLYRLNWNKIGNPLLLRACFFLRKSAKSLKFLNAIVRTAFNFRTRLRK